MNLVLFDASEIHRPLPRSDRRAAHLLDVLRRRIGDTFDAGLINGPRGKGTLAAVSAEALTLTFAWGPLPAPREPLALILGLPRPQTARDVLRDATTLGATALHFVRTEKSESSYAQSSLWTAGEWRRHVLAGAEQAFDPAIPDVTIARPLAEILATLPAGGSESGSGSGVRLALDNYESAQSLGAMPAATLRAPVALAIGAERGWSTTERELFRTHGFTLVHLGTRVLRTETAVIAALTLVRARLGLM